MTLDDMDHYDASKLNYAVGMLMGLFHKYGDMDMRIYHGEVRVRIDVLPRQMIPEDLDDNRYGRPAQELRPHPRR